MTAAEHLKGGGRLVNRSPVQPRKRPVWSCRPARQPRVGVAGGGEDSGVPVISLGGPWVTSPPRCVWVKRCLPA